MTDALQAIAEQIQSRLAELDVQIAGFEDLVRERERLVRALDTLTANRPAVRPAPSSRPRRSKQTSKSAARTRAPRGANRTKIVEHLRHEGGQPASSIAKATGISRGVVYETLAKLVAEGEVEQSTVEGKATFAVGVPA